MEFLKTTQVDVNVFYFLVFEKSIETIVFQHLNSLLAVQADEVLKGVLMLKDSSADKEQLLRDLNMALTQCLSLFSR